MFKEYIGPLGDKEFQDLIDSKGLSVESIKEYVSFLVKQGILKRETAEEFKNGVSLILENRVADKVPSGKKVNREDLKRAGLI
jgi:hypothetical protein